MVPPRSPIVLVCLCAITLAACTSQKVRTANAFRDARDRADLVAARELLSDDPRIWYDAHEGAGSPWQLEGGAWKNWDDHFQGVSQPGPWHVEEDRVWAVVWETNDYFRLCEAGPSPWTLTYFFDDDGRISGMMVSAPPKGLEIDNGRRAEFDAWLKKTHPADYEYLRPGGQIDPSGDRPQRTRELLHEWRRDVGLPPIE